MGMTRVATLVAVAGLASAVGLGADSRGDDEPATDARSSTVAVYRPENGGLVNIVATTVSIGRIVPHVDLLGGDRRELVIPPGRYSVFVRSPNVYDPSANAWSADPFLLVVHPSESVLLRIEVVGKGSTYAGRWRIVREDGPPTVGGGQSHCNASPAAAIVGSFAADPGGTQFRPRLDRLIDDPASAACHLTASLHTLDVLSITPRERGEQAEAMAVVWSLRALRFLTGGKDYRAPTSHQFPASEGAREQFLHRGAEDGSVRFFSTWMSRDTVYIAPRDAQEAIISKWRDWYANEGVSFPYEPSEHVDDWYS